MGGGLWCFFCIPLVAKRHMYIEILCFLSPQEKHFHSPIDVAATFVPTQQLRRFAMALDAAGIAAAVAREIERQKVGALPGH